MKNKWSLLAWSFLLLGSCANPNNDKTSVSMQTGNNWPVYEGNKAGNRYSPLTQINRNNVNNLKIVWEYNSAGPEDSNVNRFGSLGQMECQPIVVDGVLYGTTPGLDLFALNATTGKQLWKFKIPREREKFNNNRGVVYWQNANDKRILYTAGSYLYAVNALTGKSISDFGKDGKVDLDEGLSIGFDVSNLSVTATSPGIVYKNVLVLGSSVTEAGDSAPGYVRGFDIISGKLLWTFHTIPLPGEFGYDTWPENAYKKFGGTNNWSGMALDEKRGVVYFGTGSPSSDFYGGDRKGENLFANCILALDATTGKMKWYYQTIHHDLWDRDISCPPNLATINHNGKKTDVVVQATKDGLVYVLDRDSGTSLFQVEERPVPTGNHLPNESPWPTQKFPLKPLPFSNQQFTDSDITNISPEAHDYVKQLIKGFTYGTNFIPPDTSGILLFGYSGGAEWGGNAIDPDGILYQNANHDLWLLQMISSAEMEKKINAASSGHDLYTINCSTCHGPDRKGSSEFPSLLNIDKQLSVQQVDNIVKEGRGRMPSFSQLSKSQRDKIISFLFGDKSGNIKATAPGEGRGDETAPRKVLPYYPPYAAKTWRIVTDQNGYSAVKPPWGTLSAIDLNTGEYLWNVPLGEYPELTKKGIPVTGTTNYGGPIVTASGLVFIAATMDQQIRAFDKKTGKVVWEHSLPFGGFATPVTYEVNGRQYIAIACGGGRGGKTGSLYVAFALP